MKSWKGLIIFATTLSATTSLLLGQAAKPAESSTVAPELPVIVQNIQTKLKAGKNTEADLAPELAGFDKLLAKHAGEKSDDMTAIIYLKAMLYLQVLDNPTKGKALIEKLKTDYPNSKLGLKADQILQNLDKQAESKKVRSSLASGSPFPDFTEKDLSGNPISIGGLKGKVVLIDFWATWCGPCRAELPNVIEAYKKFHTRGFEIIGVSLDSDRDKLDAFLKKQEGMTWAQYFDGQGWQNKLAAKYGVESIPFTILVGSDGKIINTDLRGKALEAAVEKALAKK